MSDGMGYYTGEQYDPNDFGQFEQVPAPQQAQQDKNPLRAHLKKVEDQNSELQKQVAQLLARQRQAQLADDLRAKGYDPAVAALYGGEPDKLDEWLTSVGPLLAKAPTPTTGDGGAQQQGQPPASTVPAEGQAAMQQMQGAGTQAAAPQGTEAEQIALMRNTQDPAALMQILQAQGNPYHWNG